MSASVASYAAGGRYQPREVVADFGRCPSWRALDLRAPPREVILQRPGAVPDPAAFLAFVSALREVRHPQLLPVVDAGVDEGGAWIAFERFSGPSLGTLLEAARARRETPPLDGVRAVFDAVTAAVQRLHAAGLAHGAISPWSVLVAGSFESPNVRLLDAGLGAWCPPVRADIRAVRVASFDAPELLARGGATVTGDVCSLGLLLLEALAHPPEQGRTEAVPLRYEGRTDVVDEVWSACAVATSRDPAARFASVSALQGALASPWDTGEDIGESRTLLAPGSDVVAPEAAPGAPPAASSRLARMQGLSAMLLAQDVARAALSQPPPSHAPPPAATPGAPSKTPSSHARLAAAAFVVVTLVAVAAWALLR